MGFARNVQTKDAFSVAFLVTAKGTIEGRGGGHFGEKGSTFELLSKIC